MLPFRLCNAPQDEQCLIVLCFDLLLTDSEFVGMMDYILESFHDLLVGELEAIANSNSSGGITPRGSSSWWIPRGAH
jgi:hypothetical protein